MGYATVYSDWRVDVSLPGRDASQLYLNKSFGTEFGLTDNKTTDHLSFYSTCDELDAFSNPLVGKTTSVVLSGAQVFGNVDRRVDYLFQGIAGDRLSSSSTSHSSSCSFSCSSSNSFSSSNSVSSSSYSSNSSSSFSSLSSSSGITPTGAAWAVKGGFGSIMFYDDDWNLLESRNVPVGTGLQAKPNYYYTINGLWLRKYSYSGVLLESWNFNTSLIGINDFWVEERCGLLFLCANQSLSCVDLATGTELNFKDGLSYTCEGLFYSGGYLWSTGGGETVKWLSFTPVLVDVKSEQTWDCYNYRGYWYMNYWDGWSSGIRKYAGGAGGVPGTVVKSYNIYITTSSKFTRIE